MSISSQLDKLHQLNLQIQALKPLTTTQKVRRAAMAGAVLLGIPLAVSLGGWSATQKFSSGSYDVSTISSKDYVKCVQKDAPYGQRRDKTTEAIDRCMSTLMADKVATSGNIESLNSCMRSEVYLISTDIKRCVRQNADESLTLYAKPRIATLYWPLMLLVGVFYYRLVHMLYRKTGPSKSQDTLSKLTEVLVQYNQIFTAITAGEGLTDLDKQVLHNVMPEWRKLVVDQAHPSYVQLSYAQEAYVAHRDELTRSLTQASLQES